jgi:hypothetical protein
MPDDTQTNSEKNTHSPKLVSPTANVGDSNDANGTQKPLVRAAALKAAIAQLRDLANVNAKRSSQEALAANLIFLRNHGVDDEILDLVVEMTLSQNVDEEMTAAINYLASGFLLALLTLQEERTSNG